MQIQDLLGLPLQVGMKILNRSNIKLIETLPKKSKMNDYELKDPYIIRIREIENDLVEVLISYF